MPNLNEKAAEIVVASKKILDNYRNDRAGTMSKGDVITAMITLLEGHANAETVRVLCKRAEPPQPVAPTLPVDVQPVEVAE